VSGPGAERGPRAVPGGGRRGTGSAAAPVTDLSIDRGRAEPDRWPYTLPVVHHIWEHRLPLAPGATVLLGENGSGKSTLIEAVAAAFRDDWLQQTLAGPNASPHRSSARVTAKGSCRPHSPILAALPGATLLQLGQDGIAVVDYDSSHLLDSWRAFLVAPENYLRHLR